MPTPQSTFNANTSCAPPPPDGGILSGLIGLFILVCLVLPGVIWIRHEQPVVMKVPVTDAWLDFSEPQFTTIEFEAAPPLNVHLGLVHDWLSEAEAMFTMDPLEQRVLSWLPSEVNQRLLMEEQFTPNRTIKNGGLLQYEVTPSFNFGNQQLQLSGVSIKLWIHF